MTFSLPRLKIYGMNDINNVISKEPKPHLSVYRIITAALGGLLALFYGLYLYSASFNDGLSSSYVTYLRVATALELVSLAGLLVFSLIKWKKPWIAYVGSFASFALVMLVSTLLTLIYHIPSVNGGSSFWIELIIMASLSVAMLAMSAALFSFPKTMEAAKIVFSVSGVVFLAALVQSLLAFSSWYGDGQQLLMYLAYLFAFAFMALGQMGLFAELAILEGKKILLVNFFVAFALLLACSFTVMASIDSLYTIVLVESLGVQLNLGSLAILILEIVFPLIASTVCFVLSGRLVGKSKMVPLLCMDLVLLALSSSSFASFVLLCSINDSAITVTITSFNIFQAISWFAIIALATASIITDDRAIKSIIPGLLTIFAYALELIVSIAGMIVNISSWATASSINFYSVATAVLSFIAIACFVLGTIAATAINLVSTKD
jgi:hypothetical protein